MLTVLIDKKHKTRGSGSWQIEVERNLEPNYK